MWRIPEGGLKEHLTECEVDLRGHQKKVSYLEWHPTAANILLSTSYDFRVRTHNDQRVMVAMTNLEAYHSNYTDAAPTTDVLYALLWTYIIHGHMLLMAILHIYWKSICSFFNYILIDLANNHWISFFNNNIDMTLIIILIINCYCKHDHL